MDSFHSCVNSSLFQMSTMSSLYNLLPPVCINADGIWSTPVALCFLNFYKASSISIKTRLWYVWLWSVYFTPFMARLVLRLTFNKLLKNSVLKNIMFLHRWEFQLESIYLYLPPSSQLLYYVSVL